MSFALRNLIDEIDDVPLLDLVNAFGAPMRQNSLPQQA
jgi:hypothetical protein